MFPIGAKTEALRGWARNLQVVFWFGGLMLRRVDPGSTGLYPLGGAGLGLSTTADIETPMSISPIGLLVSADDGLDAGNNHPGLMDRSVRRRVTRC